jgi:hypothetical protein
MGRTPFVAVGANYGAPVPAAVLDILLDATNVVVGDTMKMGEGVGVCNVRKVNTNHTKGSRRVVCVMSQTSCITTSRVAARVMLVRNQIPAGRRAKRVQPDSTVPPAPRVRAAVRLDTTRPTRSVVCSALLGAHHQQIGLCASSVLPTKLGMVVFALSVEPESSRFWTGQRA